MRRALLVAVVGAAALATTAAALNPKTLVLHRSDMPSGAKRVSFGSSKGAVKIPRVVHGQAGYVAWKFKIGSASVTVGAAAGILKNTRDAHDVLVHTRRTITKRSSLFRRASVPRYGDEQFAVAVSAGGASSALVFVRSGTRLWEVVIFGYPKFSKARAVGQLKKYAAKEKTRAT